MTIGGCGNSGGGGEDSSSSDNAGSESSPKFSSKSSDLRSSTFGMEENIYTFRDYSNGVISDYRSVYSYKLEEINGIRSLGVDLSFIDNSGAPLTGGFSSFLISIFASIKFSLAQAEDGLIYATAINGDILEKPIPLYPFIATVGLAWDWGQLDPSQPPKKSYLVEAIGVTAPKSGITNCALVRVTSTSESEESSVKWIYFKAGMGGVERTNTNPALDQSTASGSYLVPNSG